MFVSCSFDSTTNFKLTNDSTAPLSLFIQTLDSNGDPIVKESVVAVGFSVIFLEVLEGINSDDGTKTLHFNTLGDRIDDITFQKNDGTEGTTNFFDESLWSYSTKDDRELEAELGIVITDDDF